MSEENVEITRQSYAAYNAALSAPDPGPPMRAWLERFVDPEVEWDLPEIAPEQRIYHGIDGVIEFFEAILEGFEQVRQVPERFMTAGTGYSSSSAPKREGALPVSISMRSGRTWSPSATAWLFGFSCSETAQKPSKPLGWE